MQWLIDIITDWITAQGYLTTSFVDRGDPADYDFIESDLTLDGNWHDMDLSGIVPDGAKAVSIRIDTITGTATAYSAFRKKGNTNESNSANALHPIANNANSTDLLCPISDARFIQYKFQSVPWFYIVISIKGWWL